MTWAYAFATLAVVQAVNGFMNTSMGSAAGAVWCLALFLIASRRRS